MNTNWKPRPYYISTFLMCWFLACLAETVFINHKLIDVQWSRVDCAIVYHKNCNRKWMLLMLRHLLAVMQLQVVLCNIFRQFVIRQHLNLSQVNHYHMSVVYSQMLAFMLESKWLQYFSPTAPGIYFGSCLLTVSLGILLCAVDAWVYVHKSCGTTYIGSVLSEGFSISFGFSIDPSTAGK